MSAQILTSRLKKELLDLERDPPPGVICHPIDDDDMTHLEAFIKGPPDSPYEKGTFRLDIHIPDEYPFNPPTIKFKTMIYHPNVDEGGTICLSILKMIEADGWKPSLSIGAALKSLQILMGEPNPHDPLDAEIAKEFQFDNALFMRKAKEFTIKYATGDQTNVDTTIRKPEQDEHDSLDTLSQHSFDNSAEKSNHPLERKSKLSLSTKSRKSKSCSPFSSLSSPSNNQVTTSYLQHMANNSTTATTHATTSTSTSRTNIQNDRTTPPSQSLSQHQNLFTIETATAATTDEKSLDDSHISSISASPSPSSSNPSQQNDAQKFAITAGRENEEDDSSDVGNPSPTANEDHEYCVVIDNKEESDNCNEKEIIILDDGSQVDELDPSTPSTPGSPLLKSSDIQSTLSKYDIDRVNAAITEIDTEMNDDSTSSSESKIQDMIPSSPLEKEGDSCEKSESITADKENNTVDLNKDSTEVISTRVEKGSEQHDYPSKAPAANDGYSSKVGLNDAATSSSTTTKIKRVPLQDSQSSQNISEPSPSPSLPPLLPSTKDKDKGKAVCRTPINTFSNTEEVQYRDNNIFSATDDENYMPKKRVISASMKNKLSLSRTKRQKP